MKKNRNYFIFMFVFFAGELSANTYCSDSDSHLSKYYNNYFLPVYYIDKINYVEYQSIIPSGEELINTNINFQISLKYQLYSDLFTDNDCLHIAYTQRSNWQAYVKSAYFRDTEYKPSIFWSLPVNPNNNEWYYAGTRIGVVHESNGRGGDFERSWNRLYAELSFQYKDYRFHIKPWMRLNLGVRDYNEDIMDFLGYGDMRLDWKVYDDHLLSLTIRNVFHSGFSKGYQKITWNFPIYHGVKGYMVLESGYGISISDYNHYDNAIGIGFSF